MYDRHTIYGNYFQSLNGVSAQMIHPCQLFSFIDVPLNTRYTIK
jgi:hypothetical protein